MAEGIGLPPPPNYDDIVCTDSQTRGENATPQSDGRAGSTLGSTVDAGGPPRRPDVSGSPHNSDDEETSLLKAELRRLREQNTDRKKMDLRSAIELERAYTLSGSKQFTPVMPAPAVYQPVYQAPTTQNSGGQQVTMHPMASSVSPHGATSQIAPPPNSAASQMGPLPYRSPQRSVAPVVGGTPWSPPPPAVASSSITSNVPGQMTHMSSYDPGDKQSKGATTACCVVTFFIFGFVAVVVVAIYSLA